MLGIAKVIYLFKWYHTIVFKLLKVQLCYPHTFAKVSIIYVISSETKLVETTRDFILRWV